MTTEYLNILRTVAQLENGDSTVGGVAVVREIQCIDKQGSGIDDWAQDEIKIVPTIDGIEGPRLLNSILAAARGLSTDAGPVNLVGLLNSAFYQEMDNEGESRPLPPVPLPFKEKIHFAVKETDSDFTTATNNETDLGEGIDIYLRDARRTNTQKTGSDGPGQYGLIVEVFRIGDDLPADVRVMIEALSNQYVGIPTAGPGGVGDEGSRSLDLLKTALDALGLSTGPSGKGDWG